MHLREKQETLLWTKKSSTAFSAWRVRRMRTHICVVSRGSLIQPFPIEESFFAIRFCSSCLAWRVPILISIRGTISSGLSLSLATPAPSGLIVVYLASSSFFSAPTRLSPLDNVRNYHLVSGPATSFALRLTFCFEGFLFKSFLLLFLVLLPVVLPIELYALLLFEVTAATEEVALVGGGGSLIIYSPST